MSTVFQIRNNEEYFICKNQDVIYDNVYLFTNQRGIAKTALILPPSVPASWVSVYGSIVISQIGKENPNGGMNEAGLVVEQTTLWQTEYPAPDDRPAIGELQWIQYMLDTCKSVQEVIEATSAIRIDQGTSKLHYLVADRSGDCATIEFIGGSTRVIQEDLKLPMMTNSPYEIACKEVEDGNTTWSDLDEYERNSMERFFTVMTNLKSGKHREDTVEWAFEVLASVRREDTVFSLVYDMSRLQIHAVTNRNQTRRSIRLTDFNFVQQGTSQAADLQLLGIEGANGQFVTYTTSFNYHAVKSFFRDPTLTSVFKWQISDEMIDYLAHYPESFQ